MESERGSRRVSSATVPLFTWTLISYKKVKALLTTEEKNKTKKKKRDLPDMRVPPVDFLPLSLLLPPSPLPPGLPRCADRCRAEGP